ncbi:autotransporter assembly complex protein TamB [Vibrio rumoiensis]|uniref:autotransporter assembly complex protein TamB n=1 Tax=Vibrio rumoiensis TaxID=76258 RepID=UPI000B5C2360|nr:translocation/assembly module TamB domain-containing protein [Vibrio rumoiensis]
MKRLLKWLLGIILLIPTTVLIALLLVAVLLFTNVGLNSGLWVAQKLVPEFKVGSTEGSLLPAFTLHDLEYKSPDLGIATELKRFDFSTSLDCLFEHSVCLDTIAINGLTFDMPNLPASEGEEVDEGSSSMPTIFMPIPVSLTHLALNDIDLNILGYKASWHQFSTGLYMQGRTLTLRPTHWQKIRLTLAPDDGQKRSEPVDNTPLAQRPDITLPTVTLPINLKVEQFDVDDFILQQTAPIKVNHLGFKGSLMGSQLTIPELKLDMPEADLDLKTKLTMSGDYPLTLQAKGLVKMPDYSGQAIHLDAKGSVANLNMTAALSGGVEAKIKANLKPLKATLPFGLSLQNGKAQWPLKGQSDYKVNIEHLDGHGSLEGYQFTLESQVSGADIPASDIVLDAQGNLDQIDFHKLNIDTLGGNVTGQAMVNWKAPLNWKATLGLTDIQPGLQWPQAEGMLNGSLITTGNLTSQGGWVVHFPSLAIDGKLRNYPLSLKGQLNASDKTGKGKYIVRTRGLRLSHAANSLKIKGKLDQQWDMDIAVNMPKLSETIPDLKGQAIGDIQLRGEQRSPQVLTDLSLSDIDWNQGEAKLQSLLLKGQVSPLPAPSGDIRLSAQGGLYQNHQLKDLTLAFKGNEKSHQLDLDMMTDLFSTTMAVQGGMVNKPKQAWKGQLTSAQVTLMEPNTNKKTNPMWQIDHAVAIGYQLASQRVDVQAHCWQHLPSKICLDKDLSAGSDGEATLSVQQFSFDELAIFLPQDTEINGELNVNAWLKWANNQAPQVKVKVDISSGNIVQKLDTPLTIPWDKIQLSANLQKNKLDMSWLLALTNNGQIKGQATIPNVQAQQMSIDGDNTIEGIHLGFLRPLLGEQNRLNANVNSNLDFNGPILNPKVLGNFDIEDFQLEGPMFPVDIHQGEVKTKFSGYSATLSSVLETDDGDLQLQGDANWAQRDNWNAHLRVFGDELKVESPPMVALKVKPDLTISITPQLAKITGNIDIPWGRILVEDLPESAIGVSKDEVILDENLEPVEENNGLPMALESDVTINIGDDVSLSAFGLKGYLVGSLKVSQKDKGPFILGEVRIEKGYYQSFGQDLIIQEGKILMNGPADQPYVAIKAIRNPENTQDDVIAGIQVSGPADAPEVTVFSEPSMSQTNALSYLLRGRGIEDGAGGSTMTTALIGLSLAKSGKLVGELGEAFGVQDLQLGTAGSGDDSQVTVSGYIAPGLQVKYGVGIFNALGEFTVRYELLTDFYVEAVTGVDSAVDFLYQFSFN